MRFYPAAFQHIGFAAKRIPGHLWITLWKHCLFVLTLLRDFSL